jgi:hypothetical protein
MALASEEEYGHILLPEVSRETPIYRYPSILAVTRIVPYWLWP